MASSSSASVDFSNDPHVHFNRSSGKWVYETDDGKEYEWDTVRNAWAAVLDDSLLEAQQAAYSVEGVDQSTPAAPVLAREKKRKHRADEQSENGTGDRKGRKAALAPRNTAVYVTHLPLDAEIGEIHSVFSKAGLVLEDDGGQPKVKVYTDEGGRSKGEALVVYLKEESVELAIRLLDETELRLGGSGKGAPMRVQKAEFKSKEPPQSKSGADADHTKKKRQKKADKLRSKLQDWDSDEDTRGASLKHQRLVVLKHMFSREELEQDPTLLIDLKEDVREEAETLGEVTNVTLYDLEPEGIMAIRYKDPQAAQACIKKMNGRFFGGRQVEADLHNGAKYQKSHKGDDEEQGTQRETWSRFLGSSRGDEDGEQTAAG